MSKMSRQLAAGELQSGSGRIPRNFRTGKRAPAGSNHPRLPRPILFNGLIREILEPDRAFADGAKPDAQAQKAAEYIVMQG